jgi:cell division protein FtsB
MIFAKLKRFDLVVSLACLALLSYFAWHAYHGTRGFPYRDKLLAQSAQLEQKFAEISMLSQSIETRVALMRPESVDPDMLDELARKNLDLVQKSDIIVPLSP